MDRVIMTVEELNEGGGLVNEFSLFCQQSEAEGLWSEHMLGHCWVTVGLRVNETRADCGDA
jgi:hypothetical protein